MAVLRLERIWAERTKKKILKALESLPLRLEETYRDTLTRIEKQPRGDGTLAISILRWISHSKRPLLVDELCHALAVEWDDDEEPNSEAGTTRKLISYDLLAVGYLTSQIGDG